MKVLLLNPPDRNTLVGNNPKFVDEERGFNPPLGLLLLAAVLEQRSDHDVAIIDAQAEGLSYEALEARVAAEAPDLVGVTAMTFTLVDVIHSVAAARTAAPDCKVVLGGPHVHLYPRETLELPGVDFAIMGEGEHSLLALCDRLGQPDLWHEVPGMAWFRDGEFMQNPLGDLIEDLDALPFPARHLTDVSRYSSILAKRQPVTTMFTSRGCPFQCAFCDRPHLGKRFRARSAQSVVDEFQACVELGIPEILVYDDTFTIKKQRVFDICEEIQRRGLDVGWDIRARVDTVDEPMLRALKAAGCERIHYGVEAGSDKFMKVLRKGITVEQARTAFRLTRKVGIGTLAYFMVGIPGETPDDCRQTMRLARELDPDFVHITILTPFPGTAIYRQALAEGVYDTDHWLAFAKDPQPGFSPLYWTREMGREQLESLVNEAYKSFYTRPRYILRQLLKIRSWRELRKKVKAGLKVVFLRS
ncbi:cobalamin B12-binding domain-containing protein [bacterium]|nr:cobalamin B12-binding domain-containing protein [bacterium]